MKRAEFLRAALLLALSAAAPLASAGDAAPRLVLSGHDPVAYFTDARPVKGDPRIRYDWDEGRYYFASAEHRDLFAANPDRYAPQFGGYCTGSMSRGQVHNEGHPEAWVISDGKLYVFGAPDSAAALKVRERALNDPEYLASRVPKAQKVWSALRGS